MSVIHISNQQIADAHKKAQEFDASFRVEGEKQMCRTLGQLPASDRTELFKRLYIYNTLSYNLKYGQPFTMDGIIKAFDVAIKGGKKISIFQFHKTLMFLDYNIEKDWFEGKGYVNDNLLAKDLKTIELMQQDVEYSYFTFCEKGYETFWEYE